MLRPEPLHTLRTAGDVIAAVGAATGLVALLEGLAPVAGLGVLYLLAVLWVAVRRGQVAAVASAFLSILVLNFFFIVPVHRFTIADDHNVVALVVLLVAALVVSRLADTARRRAVEAEDRARLAAAREQEAELVAEAASTLLAGEAVERLRGARVAFESTPKPAAGEVATRLPLDGEPTWLYAPEGTDVERLAEPFARLLELAVERRHTEERLAEIEAARQADSAKTALLHTISHDLRSPLTAITSASQALGGSVADEDRHELLGIIGEESERLARLVDDLLDLSRIEVGSVNPRPDWCDLREVIARARAQVPDGKVELALPEDLPLVRADPVQMERVFFNLIENAVKFSPPAQPVTISGGAAPGRVVVRVIDRGKGIPRSERARVFEPFSRGRDRAAGSGLGLAICKGFVEANGGRIALQQRDGTSFAVSFPA